MKTRTLWFLALALGGCAGAQQTARGIGDCEARFLRVNAIVIADFAIHCPDYIGLGEEVLAQCPHFPELNRNHEAMYEKEAQACSRPK